ncbi:MAG: VPLPA-CTERM sorting domain-containing protein [Pseudomonadota bacterium]
MAAVTTVVGTLLGQGQATAVPIALDFDIATVTSNFAAMPESQLDGDDSVRIVFDPTFTGGSGILLFEIPGVVQLTEPDFFPLFTSVTEGGASDAVFLNLQVVDATTVGNLPVGEINLTIFGTDFISNGDFPTVAQLNDGATNGSIQFTLENSGGGVNTLEGAASFSVVPLPATLWLLAGGVGALACAGARRRPA